ncbi:hypothetical protein [Litorimonas sp. WD9-15]|uniref:hypothetical protein n=1 Tax=Litorimonas sp. WD9-15 TaxID=3418716 RepID=UPI003CFEF1F1
MNFATSAQAATFNGGERPSPKPARVTPTLPLDSGQGGMTQAQRLWLATESAAKSPREHLTRMELARALATLDQTIVMQQARWPMVARALWIAGAGLAAATDDFEALTHAQIINAVNSNRWRRSQTPDARPAHRADLDT